MYKRRDIRESAVQFLYFTDLEDGPDPALMQDTFWEVIQENGLRKLNQAKAKALLHIAQGRGSRVLRFSEAAPPALAQLKATGNLTSLTVPMRALLRQESQLNVALDMLKTALNSKSAEDIIAARLEEAFLANRVVIDKRNDWENALTDAPSWRNKLEAVNSPILHLERISKRIEGIQNIDSAAPPEHGFEHLHASSQEIHQFRAATESLVKGILTHKNTIDEKLKDVVENYSPERVDPVDRAILRLGAYEIMHCDDIPRAVSINESIEIAKRFGTNDSARFINGILDAM